MSKLRHATLTLNGIVQTLNAALSGGSALKYLALQAGPSNSGIIVVGTTANGETLSSSDYGWRIEIPTTSIPDAPTIIELSMGEFSPADVAVLGTADDVVHIMVV